MQIIIGLFILGAIVCVAVFVFQLFVMSLLGILAILISGIKWLLRIE